MTIGTAGAATVAAVPVALSLLAAEAEAVFSSLPSLLDAVCGFASLLDRGDVFDLSGDRGADGAALFLLLLLLLLPLLLLEFEAPSSLTASPLLPVLSISIGAAVAFALELELALEFDAEAESTAEAVPAAFEAGSRGSCLIGGAPSNAT